MTFSSSPWFSIVSCKNPQLLRQRVADFLAAIPDKSAMQGFPRRRLRIPAWNRLDIRDTKTRAADAAVRDNKLRWARPVPASSRARHRAVCCELHIDCRHARNREEPWEA